MSNQTPPPGDADHEPVTGSPAPAGGPPAWTPPTGWSPEQPPAWPTAAPPAGSPPGWPQQGPPPPTAPQYGQGTAPQGGQGTAPQYGQPGPSGPWGTPPGAPPGQGAWGRGWPSLQAPKPGIVPLRPLGVGELLDGALGLIRSNPRTVLGLAAAISAVSALVQTLGLGATIPFLEDATTTSSTADVGAQLTTLAAVTSAQLIPALIASFLQVLASGMFIVLVGAAVLGRRLDASQTWGNLRPRLLGLVGLTLLLGIAGGLAIVVVIGIIVLLALALGTWAVLPGALVGLLGLGTIAYFYVRLSLASPALVMEARSPFAALRRSWTLVRGSWWRVLGILILSAVITNLLATVISVPITTVAALAADASSSLVPTVIAAGLATLVSGIITLPFGAAVTGLLYTDLRIRREALDIELVSAGVDPAADPLAPYRRNLR